MTEREKTDTLFGCAGYLPFLVIGLASLSLLLLPFSGLSYQITGLIMTTIAALIGLGIGLYGLVRYSSIGLFHDDPFHMMGVLISAGIIVFALADVVYGISLNQMENLVLPYMVASAKATALILWILGIAGYVRSSNLILKFAFPRLWSLALVLSAISVIAVSPIMIGSGANIGLFAPIWNLFYSMVLGIILASIYMQYYTLREGRLGNILRFLVLGMLTMYLQGLLVSSSAEIWIFVIINILTIESYILIGIFLICSQEMTIASMRKTA